MSATQATPRPLILVVVPCYDEEAVIAETHSRLTAVLEALPDIDFEVVYVDDGSRDATLALLREMQDADPRVRVVALSRNFGHEAATTAGMAHANGTAVAVIDADLQDPPEVLAEMLARWRAGADVAYGVRTEREGETAFRRWTASAFYRLLGRISDTNIPLDTGDFRIMDRKVVDAFLSMPEQNRFVRGMIAWSGFRQEPVPFRRAPRAAGETKYPLSKLLSIAATCVIAFSLAPLRFAIWLGFITSALAVAGIAYAVVVRLFTDSWVPGWAMLFIAILFFGGVQLTVIGILGEYVGRIYGESKRRPLYFIKERIGFPPTDRRREHTDNE